MRDDDELIDVTIQVPRWVVERHREHPPVPTDRAVFGLTGYPTTTLAVAFGDAVAKLPPSLRDAEIGDRFGCDYGDGPTSRIVIHSGYEMLQWAYVDGCTGVYELGSDGEMCVGGDGGGPLGGAVANHVIELLAAVGLKPKWVK